MAAALIVCGRGSRPGDCPGPSCWVRRLGGYLGGPSEQ